jgi:DNA helicase-2/ATP-dependent DNA helicase PcrA
VTAAGPLAGLDEGQHRAVTSVAEPLCILAGAGSGKTRVLTRRIAHRAAAGSADSRHVLALTFTRRAAGELAGRLRHLGLRDLPTTGTFHAMAWAQLHTWWKGAGRSAPELLDRKGRLLTRLLGRTTRMSPGELAAEIEWARARLVAPDGYARAAAAADRRTAFDRDRVATLYAAYEEEKRRRHLVDFDDLLTRCIGAMATDQAFADAQRWRFRHLFVDEFQDVNPLQFRLLTAWLGPRADLCVVGDPNQAIYRWNGADASFLVDFPTHFPGAEVVELVDNYRSSPQVLAVAAAVLRSGGVAAGAPGAGGGGPGRLRANRPSGPVPTIVAYPSDEDEALGVARAVRDHHRPGGRWGGQAVLVRTNDQAVLMAKALRRARIPYRVRGGTSFLARPEVRDALRDVTASPSPLTAALDDLAASLAEDPPPDTDAGDDRRAALETLVRLGREFCASDPHGTAAELRTWLSATVASDDPARGTDAVEIVTFHAAKGLEWPVVHIAGLEDGLVPITYARSDEAVAEERRLLYVALTRAEEVLRCTWAEQRTFGERTTTRRPSPWLAAVTDAASELAAAAGNVDHGRALTQARARLESSSGDASNTSDDRPGRAGEVGRDADQLLAELWAWRARVARAAGVPATVVLGDPTLAAVAARRPRSLDELEGLPGLGPVRAGEYGDTLLALVASHQPV